MDLCSIIDKYRNIDVMDGLFQNNIYNLKSMMSNLNITLVELSLFNYMTSSIIYGSLDNNKVINNKLNIKDLTSHNVNPNIPILSIEVNSFRDLDNLEILVKSFLLFFNK